MINVKPNNNDKYKQGNYIPRNKEKVIKLNDLGGIYYRSSLELKFMTWLDNKSDIIRWGAECIRVPYEIINFKNKESVEIHYYYPDFYYELKKSDGSVDMVVAEIKPLKEYNMVVKLTEGMIEIPENTHIKKLKNLEYDIKMAYKNKKKWETIIKWCELKGYKFIIITDDLLNKI